MGTQVRPSRRRSEGVGFVAEHDPGQVQVALRRGHQIDARRGPLSAIGVSPAAPLVRLECRSVVKGRT